MGMDTEVVIGNLVDRGDGNGSAMIGVRSHVIHANRPLHFL